MSESEKRDSRRIILSGNPRLSFLAAGQRFEQVVLSNLSHGGCLAMLPFQDAGALCLDTPVEDLVIQYPGMTANPIRGRIAWTMAHAEGDQVAIGIQFKEMGHDTRIALVAAVDTTIIDSAKR